MFGPLVVVCLAVYLRWQLADLPDADVSLSFEGRGAARNACTFAPSAALSANARCAPAPGSALPEPARLPGVYFADAREAVPAKGDAVIRGQLLAERIISGRFQARRALRRGTKGALDAIVIGANAVGVSATLRLMDAGLRVLIVDREGDEPLAQSSRQALLRALRREVPGGRLPLLVGHDVWAIAERADGMLEVQAERAAWYTANVIFASRDCRAAAALPLVAEAATPAIRAA